MSAQLLCNDCPYFHPANKPCPPEWTRVRSDDDSDDSYDSSDDDRVEAWQVAVWAAVAVVGWGVLVIVATVAYRVAKAVT